MSLVFLQHFENVAEAELASQVLATEDIDSVVRPGPIPGAGTFVQGADLWVEEGKWPEPLHSCFLDHFDLVKQSGAVHTN
ncbi:MAG: hypothetical protein AAB886_01945 [Patescibacteria group bacterium]